MERWIEHIVEPDRLILAWQAPDEIGDRQRWAVGELRRDGDGAVLHYFSETDEFEAYNGGQPFSKMRSYGYAGYPGFPPNSVFPKGRSDYSVEVLKTFLARLPPRNRPDFPLYLRSLRIAEGLSPTNFALLGLSEAYLPNDGFSVVDPLDASVTKLELVNEVAGYRYYLKHSPPLQIDEVVGIVREPENPYDPHAVMVVANGKKVGNINRLQAATFGQWADDGRLEAVVDRVNGRADRPRIFLFIRVRPKP